jgi:peroxiredoxin (alkyl hydroperoxide reductase subunit C)
MGLVENQILRIGDRAPGFRAVTTHGSIYFPGEYKGKWVIFFSHPEDFTLSEYNENIFIPLIEQEFKNLDCELIGLSVNGFSTTIEWVSTKREKTATKGYKNPDIHFPVIIDNNTEILREYGIIRNEESYFDVRPTVFFIDPSAIIRGIMHYTVSIGLSLEEFRRVIIFLQSAGNFQHPIPANLIPGYTQRDLSAKCYETAVDCTISSDEELKPCDCFYCASELF